MPFFSKQNSSRVGVTQTIHDLAAYNRGDLNP